VSQPQGGWKPLLKAFNAPFCSVFKGMPLTLGEHGRRSEASVWLSRGGRLELTKAKRSKTVAEEIPEGFRSAKLDGPLREPMSEAKASNLTFSARLCGDRGHQLLHARALARRTRDLSAVVLRDGEVELRLLAAIQTLIFISRHLILLGS
jgi:hypothetical protein